MARISIDQSALTIDSVIIRFIDEIKEVLEISNVIVVRIKYSTKNDNCDNLFGVIDGRLVWQVQDVREYNSNYEPDPFVGIRVYEKDHHLIIATDFGGRRFLINPHNGKIVGTESWVK